MNIRNRFKDVEWFDEANKTDCIVGGVGGIGSWLCLLLARTGLAVHAYDDDIIEEHNIGGQLYGIDHIGLTKLEALNKIIKQLTGDELQGIYIEKFNEDSYASQVMFSAFDNMEARKAMFNVWKSQEDRKIFIDGRMLLEDFQIFVVTPGREEEYEKTLFEDTDIAEQPCSAKATSHCGAMIASNMVAILTNFLYNKKLGLDIRNLPFLVKNNIPLMKYECRY